MNALRPIADPSHVRQVLCDESFLPHAAAYPATGATMSLRDQMARFSAPATHAERRAAVIDLIDGLDAGDAEVIAREVAAAEVVGGGNVESVAAVVPTVTLARLLGIECDVAILMADVEAVVRVIGRGDPPTAATDDATDRLLGLASRWPNAVAVVSVLYQNYDATAAAIRNTEAARRRGSETEAAVARTRRVATRSTAVGATQIAAGDEVVLEIGSAGMPFGAGAHECPGRLLAEAMVRGASMALAGTDRRDELPATDA